MTWMDVIPQIGILCTGLPAAFLIGYVEHHKRRWAYVMGLLAQPFWFWTTFYHGQWGMFALCFLYAFTWLRGFYNHWIKPCATGKIESSTATRESASA